MAKEPNSDESGTTKDAEFKISLTSIDIDKIEERIRNGDNVETQNKNLVNGVALINTCTNCGIKFIAKNSMTWETLCGSCVGKK